MSRAFCVLASRGRSPTSSLVLSLPRLAGLSPSARSFAHEAMGADGKRAVEP